MFTIQSTDLLNAEISILSYTGQVVKEIKATNNESVQVDVNNISNGSYLLQVKTRNGVTIKKIEILK